MTLTLCASRGWGGVGVGARVSGGQSGVPRRSRGARRGIAKAVGDAVGPGDVLVGVDKGLEAAEIVNRGGISDMFPAALGAMVANTADPEIIEARATIRGWESGELIGADGVIVED